MGETLFSDRTQKGKAHLFWANYVRDWPDPKSFLRDKHRESHLRTLGLSGRLASLETLARYLSSKREPVLRELLDLGLNERQVRRAMVFSGHSLERPNDTALIRVANRVFERGEFRDKAAESQVATAMLVGEDEGAYLYAAAIELGETICSSTVPACLLCPLTRLCSHYQHMGA
jgi:endonuclease III